MRRKSKTERIYVYVYQAILKEINFEYSLEKTLMLGKIEGRRRRG